MLRSVTTLATLLALLTGINADAASLMDQSGRWICRPDNPAWPQVLIDFDEDAYRRCDQNTCVTYPIVNISGERQDVRIDFAPDASLATQDNGGPYREQMTVAGNTLVTEGECTFNGTEDVYPVERMEPSR